VTDTLPGLLLRSSVLALDDAEARRLRAKARRAGAVLADLAEAVRLREERIAEEVVTWEVDEP
jgi:hypothetical protein